MAVIYNHIRFSQPVFLQWAFVLPVLNFQIFILLVYLINHGLLNDAVSNLGSKALIMCKTFLICNMQALQRERHRANMSFVLTDGIEIHHHS